MGRSEVDSILQTEPHEERVTVLIQLLSACNVTAKFLLAQGKHENAAVPFVNVSHSCYCLENRIWLRRINAALFY